MSLACGSAAEDDSHFCGRCCSQIRKRGPSTSRQRERRTADGSCDVVPEVLELINMGGEVMAEE